MDHFEQLVIVAVVDVDADEYRTVAVVQGSLQYWRDLLRGANFIKKFSRASSAKLLVGGQFEPPTHNKTGSTTSPQAKLNARRAAPKGRGTQRRVIRPGEPVQSITYAYLL